MCGYFYVVKEDTEVCMIHSVYLDGVFFVLLHI